MLGIITISLESTEKKFQLPQLAKELKFAFEGLSAKEWKELVLQATKIALKATARNKITALLSLVKFLLCVPLFVLKVLLRYLSKGMRKASLEDWKKSRNFMRSLPKKLQGRFDQFRKMSKEEQIEQVTVFVLSVLVFYTVSGGRDLEGGLPDKDLKLLGIGGHRNIFFHSILLGLGTEFLLRFSIEIISEFYRRLPTTHHKVWDAMHNFIKHNQNLPIAAMWAGIGAHLLKDANILKERTKVITGLPVGRSMKTHQIVLATNALVSAAFAIQEAKTTLPM